MGDLHLVARGHVVLTEITVNQGSHSAQHIRVKFVQTRIMFVLRSTREESEGAQLVRYKTYAALYIKYFF